MEAEMNRRRRGPQLEDIPEELIHLIQSLMPVKEAARTSLLSKSWLRAWSTIPTLRFRQAVLFNSIEPRKHVEVVDRTLLRYMRDNIPIESLDLDIHIENQEVASLVENWIRPIATKSCLKQLSLSIIGSFTLPHEILSGRNLNQLRVTASKSDIYSVCISNNPVMIKCMSLRELHLTDVQISEEALNNLLSTCSLLEKINLYYCKGFQTMKVKNHRFLYELVIRSEEKNDLLEIDDVPNLRLFDYDSFWCERNPLPFNMNSLRSVTQLSLGGVIIDDALLDKIKLEFPFLESLTLGMKYWRSESFSITSVTLKRLTLQSCNSMLNNVRVDAPKLLFFHYSGMTVPSFLFPAITPEQITVRLNSTDAIKDDSFFLKMREALTLSSEFKIEICVMYFGFLKALNIDIDDLKRRVSFPATNVKQLSFRLCQDEDLWEHSPFLDAFFTICHPKHIIAHRRFDWRIYMKNYFCRLLVKEALEKKTRKGYWPDYLKDMEIYNHLDRKWEIVSESWRNFPDWSADVMWHFVNFKLNWC